MYKGVILRALRESGQEIPAFNKGPFLGRLLHWEAPGIYPTPPYTLYTLSPIPLICVLAVSGTILKDWAFRASEVGLLLRLGFRV